MKRTLVATTAILLGTAAVNHSANAAVTFTTFVTSSDIQASEGQSNVIAFNYTGSGFVGSVYFGGDNNQLYSTNLGGTGVAKFGGQIPGFSAEVVVAAGLGQAGFTQGAVYAGDGNGQIYRVPSSGAPVLFGTTPDGSTVRQILFDPGSSFGGRMLVTTSSGLILSFDSTGNASRQTIANIGADTEGMDIASSKYGALTGQLLVSSEGTGLIHAVSPGGVVTTLKTASGNVTITEAETVSVVPLDLGVSGNPLEGFYVANYPGSPPGPGDILKADASQFAGLQGDAIVTSELSANSPVWDLSYNGDGLGGTPGTFTVTQIGTLPNQSEDGIFVTAQRLQLLAPEPGSLALLGTGLGALGLLARRRRRD